VTAVAREDPSFLSVLVDDGRPLIMLTAVALLLSGLFAIFLAARREFLPHDIAYLGLNAEHLCGVAGCRIVRFMFHDRVAFGGTLLSVAALYLWLAAVPLREGARWAWQALAVSGTAGFLSFLAYLGYGYLDSWHGIATLALFPCFVAGLARSRPLARLPHGPWLRTDAARAAAPSVRIGRWCLLATAAGMVAAGITILVVGMTRVFVPQDLAFIGLSRPQLAGVSPQLIPLIAHDRAGFGGGLLSAGLLVGYCAWYATPGRAFSHATAVAGLAGFGCAIGVHFVEGYTSPSHLAPAFLGAALFVTAVALEAVGGRCLTRPSLAGVPPRP
jgi:hypothetical protein